MIPDSSKNIGSTQVAVAVVTPWLAGMVWSGGQLSVAG